MGSQSQSAKSPRRLPRSLVAAAVVFAGLLLFGDRLSFRPPGDRQIRFAHTFTTDSERRIVARAIAEFEQTHPGISIEQIISNSETYNTFAWRLQFRGKHPPDIYFQWQGYKVQTAIDQGWALELSPFLSRGAREQFIEPALPDTPRIYFLPHSIDLSNLVWFNRALYEQLGLPLPASLDEWIANCSIIRKAQWLPLVQGNRDLWPVGNMAAEWCAEEAGADSFAALFARGPLLASPPLGALSFLVKLKQGGAFDYPGIMPPDAVLHFSDIDAKVIFLSKRAAQHVVGSWFVADLEDARAKNELLFPPAFFPLPPPSGKPNLTTGVITGFMVHRQTRHPIEAVAFLELLLSRKYQAEFAKVGSLSARRDAAEFAESSLARDLLQVLSRERSLLAPPDTAYPPEEADIFYRLCARVFSGELPAGDVPAFWLSQKSRLAKKTFP